MKKLGMWTMIFVFTLTLTGYVSSASAGGSDRTKCPACGYKVNIEDAG